MKTVREAQEAILANCSRLKAEEVDLRTALGRVLAEDIFSNRNHPPYDISAMDGYAVRHADIEGSTRDNPAMLDVVDDIRAGARPAREVPPGACARIMTGAPIPNGADTVIRVEDTAGAEGGARVGIFVPQGPGTNIRSMGENLMTGDMVLAAGSTITPAAVGILAMVKRARVPVVRRPRVAILSTGDELEGLEEPFDPEKIPDANSYTIMADLQALGIEPVLLGIARDRKEELVARLREGVEYDALVVSGGVAVGHHDFVRPSLADVGVDMLFWRVALRPGHPFAFGIRKGGGAVVFGLPGNPVSSMVCTAQFIVPAMRRMMGHAEIFRRTFGARLASGVKDKAGRLHFMRVALEDGPKGASVRTTGSQGSGILMSMARADGLMVVPAEADSIPEGAFVTVQSLCPYTFQREPGF